MSEKNNTKTPEIRDVVAKIQARVMAFVIAVICGLTIFIATIWLIIKGGDNVGYHLGLLGNYFPGYDVTWAGSFVGLLYGTFVGGAVGWLIGYIYNRVVDIRKR